jgi:hypothetical protein
MEMDKYHKYVNFIVSGDRVIKVGVKATPRVALALYYGDDLAWEQYLRIIDESVNEYNQYLSNMPQDSEAQN